MCEIDTETHRYRRLWLDSAHELGQVAECLSDALAWQPAHEGEMPDALELAQVAATRLAQLEPLPLQGGPGGPTVAVYQPPLKARRQREYA